MAGRGFSGAMRNVAASHGNVPILRLLLGLLLVGFFLLALMLEIQTSEAFLLNGAAVTLAPNWGVLLQPWELFHGQLALDMAKAVMWGWGIELVYLVCVVGETSMGGRAGKFFKTGAIILVGFNFWTNLNYGTMSSGFGGQIAFAAITSFIVAFFGVLGLNMIFSAIMEMS